MARKITLTKEQIGELKKLAEYSKNADEAKKIRERFKAFTEDNFDALKEGIDVDGLVLGVKVTKQLTVKEAVENGYVVGKPEVVRSQTCGVLKAMLAGLQRDGDGRKIDGYLSIHAFPKGKLADVTDEIVPGSIKVNARARMLKEFKFDPTDWSFIIEGSTGTLETSVREAIDGLYVLGQEELVRSNFFGLMKSASDGIRRDGHARQIGDHITIYPVVTGEIDLDYGWNPAVNGVRIIARLLNELELDITNWSFEDVTPGKQSFKLNTVSTLGVEGVAEVGKVIALNGSGLPKTDAIRVDWAVEGTDKGGTIPAAKVTSNDVRANIAANALAELASEEYDGKTIVFTVRGNFSSAKIAADKLSFEFPDALVGVPVDTELTFEITFGETLKSKGSKLVGE